MKIIVAYDGTDAAKKALTAAQKRAVSLGGSLTLLASATDANPEGGKIQRLEKELEEARMLCKVCKIDCNSHLSVRGLSAGEDIVRYASENKVDEIVIGLKKRSQLGKMIFGSTARHVIMAAHCPVLSVK